uniref:ATP synthase complex subunit 8 n=1 Tax=Trigonopterus carinirostris TaxID=2576104 RepID=A0A7H1KI08_9CUCU|nr:ATP synthase F0 subunit 8 [Trigonopterus carinirostris]QNT26924.1 ATP synthase F0 subunit 8 [Trigonopterus carinirostris]
MPQMAPINWTLIYILIIFLFLVIIILAFYTFKYKLSYSKKTPPMKIKTWK